MKTAEAKSHEEEEEEEQDFTRPPPEAAQSRENMEQAHSEFQKAEENRATALPRAHLYNPTGSQGHMSILARQQQESGIEPDAIPQRAPSVIISILGRAIFQLVFLGCGVTQHGVFPLRCGTITRACPYMYIQLIRTLLVGLGGFMGFVLYTAGYFDADDDDNMGSYSKVQPGDTQSAGYGAAVAASGAPAAGDENSTYKNVGNLEL